ncbi:MAG: dihydrolipoyl dehydrogenase [Candidatus Midichloria sp.]|nr:dihydrolipoyl dehydrogenase [Candidatus Midichloria sp.]
MQEFDVVVIGGGPGGYVCAIKAAQLGKKVACIEMRERLGGTCLNVGCIPSKTLLNSSHKYFEASKHFAEYGVEFKELTFSLEKMQARKEKVVNDLGKGIEGLFRKNKVSYINGFASFIDQNTVEIKKKDRSTENIKAQNFVIATGSEPISLPSISIDEEKIVSSTGALSLKTPPKKMIVLGAGVIGLEMASVWSRLGSEVTIVEYADKILATADADISKEMQKILEKQGIKFILQTKALKATKTTSGISLEIEKADANKESIEADILLVAIGRKPYTIGLNLENIGLKLDAKARIEVNDNYLTSVNNIYAIGDVIKGPMLAHKAEEEGIAVAEIIAGQHGHVNYNAIPSVVYTHPEVAYVGKTEDQIKAEGIDYKVGQFPFLANSRARTSGESEGFVKIITSKSDDVILGAHIIGINAGELIGEICVSIEFKAAAEDIARTSHAHPGYSEAIKEASLAAFASAIHI